MSAQEWIDTPVLNFIVIITKTKKIGFLRVEVKGHNWRTVPRICLQTKVRLPKHTL